MLIADRILMLALSPETGLPQPGVSRDRLQRALTAALVAELALMRRIRLDGGGCLEVSDALPLSHPLLGEALRVLGVAGQALPAQQMLHFLQQRMADLRLRIADGLFRRDLLHRGVRWRWWLWPQRVYPLRSRQARNECLAQLHPADPVSAAAVVRRMVLALASSAGILDALPAADAPADVGRRAQDAIGSAISESVRDPLQALMRELARFTRG
jgi:hypothetical protein